MKYCNLNICISLLSFWNFSGDKSKSYLVEGESKLVSVEYFGIRFASIFIAEYGIIIFFGFIILFIPGNLVYS